MSGTASVPTQFAAAVTATGAQLDANYSTIVAYINDPTNRNNFAVDSGTTNTVVLSFSPAVVGGYTTGLEITFKAAATNAGAVVVNANGLGNKNFLNPDGTALSGGQMMAGSTYKGVYDGTSFIGIGFGSAGAAATQAQMETATALNVFASPGTMKYSPFAAKAWAACSATGGTLTTYISTGISSITRTGTGSFTVVFATPFSSANYAVLPGAVGDYGGAQSPRVIMIGTAFTPTTSSVAIFISQGSGPEDPVRFSFAIFGDLP